MYVKNLGYPTALKIGDQKPSMLTSQLNGNFNDVYVRKNTMTIKELRWQLQRVTYSV